MRQKQQNDRLKAFFEKNKISLSQPASDYGKSSAQAANTNHWVATEQNLTGRHEGQDAPKITERMSIEKAASQNTLIQHGSDGQGERITIDKGGE